MKKKIISICSVLAIGILFITSCGTNSNVATDTPAAEQTETAEAETKTSSNKSGKGKYKNIDADTKPVGISDSKIVIKDGSLNLQSTIYKNDGEDTYVTVTYEIFKPDGSYWCDQTHTTRRILTVGDEEKLDTYFYYTTDGKTEEDVAKMKVNVKNIEEMTEEEYEEQEAYREAYYEAQSAYNAEEYEKALLLVESALEEYPDDKDLKLLKIDIESKIGDESE